MDTILTEALIRDIVSCVQKETRLDTGRLFFFGSQVTGTARETSDIDVGYIGDEPLSFETLARIKNHLEELYTLRKIDFVDCTQASPDFKAVALAHVIPIIP